MWTCKIAMESDSSECHKERRVDFTGSEITQMVEITGSLPSGEKVYVK